MDFKPDLILKHCHPIYLIVLHLSDHYLSRISSIDNPQPVPDMSNCKKYLSFMQPYIHLCYFVIRVNKSRAECNA